MTVLPSRHGWAVSFWKPVRDVLQRWRICLASLVFVTIFLTNNFGLSTGTNGVLQTQGHTTTLAPTSGSPRQERGRSRDPSQDSPHGYHVNLYSSRSRTSNSENSNPSHSDIITHRKENRHRAHDHHSSSSQEHGVKEERSFPKHKPQSSDITAPSSSSISSSSTPGSHVHNTDINGVQNDVSSVTSVDNDVVSSSRESFTSMSSQTSSTDIKIPHQSSVLSATPSESRDLLVSSASSPGGYPEEAPNFSENQPSSKASNPTRTNNQTLPQQNINNAASSDDRVNNPATPITAPLTSVQESPEQAGISTTSTSPDDNSILAGNLVAPSIKEGRPQRYIAAPYSQSDQTGGVLASSPPQKETYAMTKYKQAMSPTNSSSLNTQQCLVLKDIASEVCSKSAEGSCKRTMKMRSAHLNFCSMFPLYHTIPQESHPNDCQLEQMPEEKCRNLFGEVQKQDQNAKDIFCKFEQIFAKFDCTDPFSARWNCKDCKEAYKNWVCSQMISYYRGTELVRPCPRYCELVENKCPYFKPHIHDTYAGEPTFICRDWDDIPNKYFDVPPASFAAGEEVPIAVIKSFPCHQAPPCDDSMATHPTSVCISNMTGYSTEFESVDDTTPSLSSTPPGEQASNYSHNATDNSASTITQTNPHRTLIIITLAHLVLICYSTYVELLDFYRVIGLT